jgi:hypothetical protein
MLTYVDSTVVQTIFSRNKEFSNRATFQIKLKVSSSHVSLMYCSDGAWIRLKVLVKKVFVCL